MASEIGVTVLAVVLSTYRIFPSGVIAIDDGDPAVAIGGSAWPVATEIGVTQPGPW